MFPGQGSQIKGMGSGLFDKYKEYVKIADDILGYSIENLCTNNPDGNLDKTQYTQPALFIVNALEYLEKSLHDGEPDYVAGHSLGEYNALFAAKVFDFATGIRLVKKRGELMSKPNNGCMAAIIGLDEMQIVNLIEENHLDYIYIANYNSPSQIVVSGTNESIQKAQKYFEESGATAYMILNVSGAFHSIYMEESKKEFDLYLNSFDLMEPRKSVIANLTARPYIKSELKSTLVNQITNPVCWTDSMLYLMKLGIDIVQVGPGKTLTGLTRQIKRALESNTQLLNAIEIEQ